MSSGKPDSSESAQIEGQIRYFARRRPIRMEAVETPYVLRHFTEAMNRIGLSPGERVCEWGAGMGRFSALFARQGCPLTAIELSPELAGVCRETLAPWPDAQVEVGDILAISEQLKPDFDVVAGFFMLHHLPSLENYFRMAKKLLRPGGRIVFVEPNPLNPLYALQITATPGMRWREEKGVYRMWPGSLRRAAAGAGFADFSFYRYGALPRGPYNLLSRLGLERTPEYVTPPPMRPFQVFSASLGCSAKSGSASGPPRTGNKPQES